MSNIFTTIWTFASGGVNNWVGYVIGALFILAIVHLVARFLWKKLEFADILGKFVFKKKKDAGLWTSIVVVGLVLFFGGASAVNGWVGGSHAFAAGDNDKNLPAGTVCPTSGTTKVVFDVLNTRNITGAETYDVKYYFDSADGDHITGTDSTSPTAFAVNRGVKYTVTVVSGNGASGNNSKIVSILQGQGATLNSDGTVSFTTPCDGNYYLEVGIPQHATLQFQAYDNKARENVYDSSDANAADFEGDDVTFESTTNNATAYAITAAGQTIDWDLSVQAVQDDTEFCDNGCYIGVVMPVTEWDTPRLKMDGVTLEDVKGTLTGSENKQLSTYTYVYKYDGQITNDIKHLSFYGKSNADASTALQIDFIARGKYLTTLGGTNIFTGSAKDDSSATTVYTIMDTNIAIS